MLVAALHSGPGCYIVSGDNFRNLKACIGRDVVPLFEQWQRYRQYFLTQRFNSPYMVKIFLHTKTYFHLGYNGCSVVRACYACRRWEKGECF